MDREADVSGILSQTVDVIGGAGRAVLIYVLILGIFSGIGGLFGLVSMEDNLFSARWIGGGIDTQTAGLFQGLFALGNMVLFVIASYFLLVQMLHALGRSMSAGARFWSFVGMSILAGIGVGIGFMLLFIPGIIVMVRWSAANGYLLSGEHSITDSLGASWEATKGHGWSIFGAGLLLWIGLTVLNSVILGVVMGTGIATGGGGLFSPMFALGVTLSSFVETFGNALNFAFSMAVFHLVAPADTSVADAFE